MSGSPGKLVPVSVRRCFSKCARSGVRRQRRYALLRILWIHAGVPLASCLPGRSHISSSHAQYSLAPAKDCARD